jgi:cell wall-associated NlpC family hydrolase
VDSIVELAESLIGSNAQDGSADKFVEGVGDDASTTAWCSEFAKYVLQNCGHYNELPDWYKNLPDTRDEGKNAACSIHQAAKDAGAVVSAAEAQPGDLVLLRNGGVSLANHTGLVLKIENGKLYTIEGNTLGEGGRGSVRILTYNNANSDRFVYCKVTP